MTGKFFGRVMRGEKMEHQIISGIVDWKGSKGRLREKMT